MDDNPPKENPPADFNKLDLSQLQGFSFGTQWTQEKPSAPGQSEGDRPRREDRRDGPAGDRRDRRGFRRPAGGPGGDNAGGSERRGPTGALPPRREGGEDRGGARREGYGGGDRGPRAGSYGGRSSPPDRGPYESPYYGVMFYPEDTSFNTLVQTIRKSCRTVELFEIARTVVAKTDRFVVVVSHKPSAAAAGEAATRPAFHISVPDGMPFESDEAAVAHVLSNHLGEFFDASEVEVDPPKGNFQVINKCGVTGELLGPPNYHRYTQIVQQHHAAKLARMPFEAFRSRIETVRDPEVVTQWLEKMKKTTRYTWKTAGKTAVAVAPAVPESPTAESLDPGLEAKPEIVPEAEAGVAAPAEATTVAALTFDSLEDARLHLLTHARDKVVRTAEIVRFPGKVAELMAPGEIRRAIEGAWERQQRFPLDTANALRGRLRREHLTIFKKGSKGVSYVCAVKRKFRIPGQTFADSIGALISFIENNPMIRASELGAKLLGIVPPPAARLAETRLPAVPTEGSATPVTERPEIPKAEVTLSIDDRARLARLQGDLMWLVREGYVTEFIDGRLFAPPPMVEARKKEIENEEHDPENFPEAPTALDSVPPVVKPPVEAGDSPAIAPEPENLEKPIATNVADDAPAPNQSAPVPNEAAPPAAGTESSLPASEEAKVPPSSTIF